MDLPDIVQSAVGDFPGTRIIQAQISTDERHSSSLTSTALVQSTIDPYYNRDEHVVLYNHAIYHRSMKKNSKSLTQEEITDKLQTLADFPTLPFDQQILKSSQIEEYTTGINPSVIHGTTPLAQAFIAKFPPTIPMLLRKQKDLANPRRVIASEEKFNMIGWCYGQIQEERANKSKANQTVSYNAIFLRFSSDLNTYNVTKEECRVWHQTYHELILS